MACNCEGKTYNIGMGCCVPVLGPVENYYTKYQVDRLIEGVIESGCCITPEQVDEKIESAKTEIESEIPSLDGYATKEYLSGYTYDKDTIDEKISSGGTFDPTQYYNKTQVDNLISAATSGYVTNSELIQYISNLQEQIESLVGIVSGCCSQTGETLYRWITMVGENDYVCSGTTKYTKEKKQQSTDGLNWSDVVPSEYRMGDTVLETDSEDCGYVPPILGTKFQATYPNGVTYGEDCDGDGILTSASTKPSGYDYTTMRSAVIGDCINTVYFGAFEECENLTSVTIADTVTTIKNNAFNQCYSLQSVVIPSGVTTIENGVFNACSGLTSVTIPDTVTTIGSGAFNYCLSLSSVTIPSSVTYIMASAFEYCRALQNVEIPSGVTRIGHDAFKDCTSLQSITCRATTPPELYIGGNFDNTNNCPIYVPAQSVEWYKSNNRGWTIYADRIQPIP